MILALKIVLGFVLKKGVEWVWLCRELFFEQDMPDQAVEAYMRKLKVRTTSAGRGRTRVWELKPCE